MEGSTLKRSLYSLLIVGSLLTACGSMPGRAPAQVSPPAAAPAPTTEQQLVPLLRRLINIEEFVRQRGLAEREARSIAAAVVAQPSFTGIQGCFEVPKQLTLSDYYESYGSVMDVQYAVACLFGAKKLDDQKAKAKQGVPVVPRKK